MQEEWAFQMHVESLADRDRDILITLAGVFCLWWVIAIVWFRRRREDGSRLFERGRWLRVLTTLLFATAFCTIAYDVWYSDVYRLKSYYHDRQDLTSFLENSIQPIPTEVPIAPLCMVRLNFDVAVDGLEVVIDYPNGAESTFTPAHHGIMVQLSEVPGTYKGRAMLKGEHVASGEVTLVSGQLAEIKVPKPKLAQLITGRWESDPNQKGLFGESLVGDSGDEAARYEFELENDLATFAIHESAQIDREQFRVKIDESVTPALIDLTLADGQQLMGIVEFRAGRKSHVQPQGGFGMTPASPNLSDGPMEFGGYGDEGGEPMSMFGGSASPMPSEPDRLQICVTQGPGLRPWDFRVDEARGYILFSLVRSREAGTLREKLAFEPVMLETSAELITESVQAWSKRLKIDGSGTNSIGMELVLVPPTAYHLVDQPQLAELRRELPEPDSIRDLVLKDPSFEYLFPPKLKERISSKHKVVSYPFVMSRQPVSFAQFQEFIDETGYATDAERGTPLFPEVASDSSNESPGAAPRLEGEPTVKPESVPDTKGGWRRENRLFNWAAGLSWQNEKSTLDDDDGMSASVISWRDATEFCKWLSKKEERQYRLPKNEEWTAAMQLGAARRSLPSTNSDNPMLNDCHGWFDATSQHPLNIARTGDTFAEWTLDAQFGSKPDRMVLVHHEKSADGVRFYLGTQFTADKSFRAVDVGFRVVAELQVLAAESPDDESSEVEPVDLFQ